jgi:superfamily II DNA/RNA helicase
MVTLCLHSYHTFVLTILYGVVWIYQFQKLLFSATLSDNPGQLAGLALRNPIFFTEARSLAKRYKTPNLLTVLISFHSLEPP